MKGTLRLVWVEDSTPQYRTVVEELEGCEGITGALRLLNYRLNHLSADSQLVED